MLLPCAMFHAGWLLPWSPVRPSPTLLVINVFRDVFGVLHSVASSMAWLPVGVHVHQQIGVLFDGLDVVDFEHPRAGGGGVVDPSKVEVRAARKADRAPGVGALADIPVASAQPLIRCGVVQEAHLRHHLPSSCPCCPCSTSDCRPLSTVCIGLGVTTTTAPATGALGGLLDRSTGHHSVLGWLSHTW